MLYIFEVCKTLCKKKKISKEFKPLFACSEPSPACYMVPCVYKVILNSFKKYKIIVFHRFLVNFYGQGQFIRKSWYDYVIMVTSSAPWLP